jgi:YbbR domain-containing protein
MAQNNQIKRNKVQQAKKIASKSKGVTGIYNNIESLFIRFFRSISTLLDKMLFGRFAIITSLLLAIVMVATINFGITDRVLNSYKSVETLEDFKVTLIANTEVYEIAGVPEVVDVQMIGELADIQSAKSQSVMSVVADLSGLSEGTHQIKLKAVDHSPRVQVRVEPSSIVVKISRKSSQKFNVGYDFINREKMDQMFALLTPEFASTEVIVRASQETLDSIASVKALIDVTGVNADFEQEALLVAYNQAGDKIKVDIVPNKIKVLVRVATPSKVVPIIIEPVGELGGNRAVDSIAMDNQSVTLYAPESVLSKISEIRIPVDVTKMTSDTQSVAAIMLPSGVNKSSVSKVSFSIKFGVSTTKIIKNIPLSYQNHNSGYRFSLDDSRDAYVDVTLYGTENNLKKITVEMISVYLDFSSLKVGNNQPFKVLVTGTNPWVRYVSSKEIVSISVAGN